MYLGELISDYILNEKICDLYNKRKPSFAKYGNCLGYISTALVYRQHMLCYLMLKHSGESKSIPKFLNRITDTKILDDKRLDNKLKVYATSLKELFANSEKDINSLSEYRYDVYAHWNKQLFDTGWQKDFINKNKFNYNVIIDLCAKCYNVFSEMLLLLGAESFTKSVTSLSDIESLIKLLM